MPKRIEPVSDSAPELSRPTLVAVTAVSAVLVEATPIAATVQRPVRSATVARPAASAAQSPAVVSGLASLVGAGPSGAGGGAPTTPAEFFTAVLAVIRREINRLFFNHAPTAAPQQTVDTDTGLVTGALNASDPEDDPLRYSVLQAPSRGTVSLDSAGNYTYTPDLDLAASGGTDELVVQIRDTGFHLSFWAPTTTNVPITVTVPAVQQISLPSASIADLSVVEGNGEHAHFMFTVRLSKASATSVTVQYATAGGTATGGVDYVEGAGTVTFAPGVTSQTVHVDIKGDTVAEPTETFTVTLSNPSGATVSRDTATGTITDDDSMQMPDDSEYVDISTFGVFHGSDHTDHSNAFEGGRTAITTEALVAYNNLREFAGLAPATIEQVGTWAFANHMTNNAQAWDNDLQGVGLFYAMQGAKVGWFADDKFDPQIVADIERTARLGSADDVMAMVEEYGHDGFADFLTDNGYETTFIDTLKMEPHYAGWMHDRAQGNLSIEGVATSHDVNHLTVLSHDQMQPFMNDTWDWPQWPALDVSHAGVIEYFQSMVTLGNPVGQNLSDLHTDPHM